jgi:ABC-type polar amino acid transport system ATPase subunit
MSTSDSTHPASATIVEIKDLARTYDGYAALDDISLAVKQGEVLSVVGPSGSGKSTLLRCMCLLDSPTRGQIDWPLLHVHWSALDTPSLGASLALLHRSVGIVFQGLNLWDDRSVWDNLTLAPRLVLNESLDDISRRAEAICERLRLARLKTSWAWQLSGGERQRVALARALMMNPSVLLLDEVTSALDPLLTVDVMDLLSELRERGMTMIIVSHHLEFAARISDRMIFLSNGRIIQAGHPRVLLDSPVHPLVSDFFSALRKVH